MTDGRRPKDADHAAADKIRAPRDVALIVARGIGQTLITVGLVVLLFVVYEVYVTDLFGHQKQQSATAALDERWKDSGSGRTAGQTVAGPTSASASARAAGTTGEGGSTSSKSGPAGTRVVVVDDPAKMVTDPSTRKRNYEAIDGQGFAKIFIPTFGADYAFTIIQGTTTDDLYAGPGHYQNTQFPGEPGNFSVAGHRVSKGSPFNELGLLSSCDAMVVETQSDWFVYRVMPMDNEIANWASTKRAHCAGVSAQSGQYARTFGREITDPSDYAQVLPVPHVQSQAVPADAERLMTLTTCHPQFSDAQRMIIHGVLVKSYKRATGFVPPELNES